jgi:hypothetical protein
VESVNWEMKMIMLVFSDAVQTTEAMQYWMGRTLTRDVSRKWTWLILGYCPNVGLELLKKSHEKFIKIACTIYAKCKVRWVSLQIHWYWCLEGKETVVCLFGATVVATGSRRWEYLMNSSKMHYWYVGLLGPGIN